MCVPWELNPQPFALLTQWSTTEPQKHHPLKIHITNIFLSQKEHKHIINEKSKKNLTNENQTKQTSVLQAAKHVYHIQWAPCTVSA